MRVAAVLSENFAAKALTDSIKRTFPKAALAVFNDIGEAYDYCSVCETDIAFVDVNLCGGEMEKISSRFKDTNSKTDIVFVTGMNGDDIACSIDEWLLSPVLGGEQKEPDPQNETKHEILLYVQCFGNFDVFKTDRTRLNFKRKKSKELFAYLVYRRGAACTNAEIASILFDDGSYDRSRQQYIQKIISYMMDTLSDAGVDEVIIRNRGSISLDVTRLQCDYYRFTESDGGVMKTWSGEFMTQYSWAESVAGYISVSIEKNN